MTAAPDAPGGDTPKRVRSNLQLRVMSAIVLAAITLSLTWAGGVWFRAFAAAVAVLMFHEWTAMSGARRHMAHFAVLWAGMAIAALAILTGQPAAIVFGLVAGCVVAAAASALVLRQGPSGGLGLAYATLSGAALALLRGDEAPGLLVILYLFAVVWATDIAAYYAGRRFGGPKLAPSISPGKTWSGAVGGAAGAVLAGLAVAIAAGFALSVAAACALLLSIVSQAGDLFESAAKRRFGVKDSSALIPGHGGVLDRVDGLVAAAIALYVIGWLLSESGGAAGLFLRR